MSSFNVNNISQEQGIMQKILLPTKMHLVHGTNRLQRVPQFFGKMKAINVCVISFIFIVDVRRCRKYYYYYCQWELRSRLQSFQAFHMFAGSYTR